MIKLNRRTRILASLLAGAFAIYLIVGFVFVPWVARQALVAYVTRDLGHQLTIGAVEFNPLKFNASVNELDLRDPDGGQLLRFKRLDVKFELSSAIDRVWTFAAISLLQPSIHAELRRDGRLNFSRLIEAMRSSDARDGPLPSLRIGRVELIDGNVEFADPASGEHARLVLSEVGLYLHDLSTLDSEQGRYTLSARTAAGETLHWSGEGGLNPLRASGKIGLSGWKAATLAPFLGRYLRLEAPTGHLNLSANYRLGDDRGAMAGRIDGIKLAADDLALVVPGTRQPLLALAALRVDSGHIDVGGARLTVGDVQLDQLRIDLHDDGGPDGWRAAIMPAAPVSRPAPGANAAIGTAPGASASPWSIDLPNVKIADSALAISQGAGTIRSEAAVERLWLRFAAHALLTAEATEIALRDVALTMNSVALGRGSDRVRFKQVTAGIAGAAAATSKTVEATGVDLQFTAPDAIVAGTSVTLDSAAAAAKSLRLNLRAGVMPQASPQFEASTLRLVLARAKVRRVDDSLSVTKLALGAGSVTMGASAAPARPASAAAAAEVSKVDVAASGISATMAGISTVVETIKGAADGVTLASASGTDRRYADTAAVGGLRMVMNQIGVQNGPDSIRLGNAVLAASRMQADYGATGAGKPDAMPLLFQGAMTDLSVELADIEGARSGSAAAQVKLTRAVAGVKTLALQRSGDGSVPLGPEVTAEDLRVEVEAFNARQGNDALRLATSAVAVDRLRTPLTAPGAIALTALRVEGTGATARRGTAEADTIELGRGSLTAASAAIELDNGLRDLRAEGAAAQLQKLVLRHPAAGTELARFGLAEVEGASVRLAQRNVSVARVALREAAGQAVIDAGGSLDWIALVGALAPQRAAAARGEANAAQPWQVTLKSAQVTDLAVALTDQGRTPALTLGLDAVNFRAENIETHGAAPAQVELTASVRSGGRIEASGEFYAGSLATDLNVTLTDIDLKPAQSIMDEFANLEIMSASASAAGRLRYRMAESAGANLVYDGSLALFKVLINETAPRVPLVAANALTASEVRLTLGPDALEIPDLRVSGLDTRLLIAEDQTVNLGGVLKPRPAATGSADSGGAFPLSIGRIRVEHGRLDFADRSLRPQFSVRIHEIGGTVTGVSSTSTTPSRLQLEGRVDEFGYARIRGDLKLLAPQEYAKVAMTFRNLEMTALTPYTAKFAGYRIASGKLSLDLNYTLENKRLVGQNRILLDKLELGEKVDSPSALDLPIELAIALLKDDQGRIDIGLPVQGSLDDPKFDIGDLIGKAIGNLIGGIVTAPFKLLAAMFGGGSEQLDSIMFDPGSARLLPPEREKLRTVAAALSKRPQLALKVKPGIAAAADAAAMQLVALRRAVLAAAGLELGADEDPGSVDFSSPRIQKAIDIVYAQQLGLPALRDRRAAFAQLAASEGAEQAQSSAPDRMPMMYRNLFEHLMPEGTVSESVLLDLGRRRGEAIAAELTRARGVGVERVSTQPPAPASESTAGAVPTALELVVAQ